MLEGSTRWAYQGTDSRLFQADRPEELGRSTWVDFGVDSMKLESTRGDVESTRGREESTLSEFLEKRWRPDFVELDLGVKSRGKMMGFGLWEAWKKG